MKFSVSQLKPVVFVYSSLDSWGCQTYFSVSTVFSVILAGQTPKAKFDFLDFCLLSWSSTSSLLCHSLISVWNFKNESLYFSVFLVLRRIIGLNNLFCHFWRWKCPFQILCFLKINRKPSNVFINISIKQFSD